VLKFSQLKADTTYVGTPVRELRSKEGRSVASHPLAADGR